MKKGNLVILILVILIIGAILGYSIWNYRNQNINNINPDNNQINNINQNLDENNSIQNTSNFNNYNSVQTNELTSQNTNQTNYYTYVGDWYISRDAYFNAEKIDEVMDLREDNIISMQEFENQMQSDINVNVPELDVEYCNSNQIKFDFQLTSPAPTQREGKLDNIVVNLTNNIGTFTYTDNWGTMGNGTITLKENSIELKLETTKAAQGALWGVEGIYTFSYKIMD